MEGRKNGRDFKEKKVLISLSPWSSRVLWSNYFDLYFSFLFLLRSKLKKLENQTKGLKNKKVAF